MDRVVSFIQNSNFEIRRSRRRKNPTTTNNPCKILRSYAINDILLPMPMLTQCVALTLCLPHDSNISCQVGLGVSKFISWCAICSDFSRDFFFWKRSALSTRFVLNGFICSLNFNFNSNKLAYKYIQRIASSNSQVHWICFIRCFFSSSSRR